MPRRKTAGSLWKSCVKVISKELKKIKLYRHLEDYRQNSKYFLNKNGTNFSLPENLTNSIYNCLKLIKGVNIFNIQLFIRTLKKFTVTEKLETLLLLIKIKLPHLQILHITAQSLLTSSDMKDLLPHFPNLAFLDISYTNADNEVLDIILQMCLKLKHLNIKHTKLQDFPFLKYRFQKNYLTQLCHQLQYLNIDSNSLKPEMWKGVFDIFPSIKILKSHDILTILDLYVKEHSSSFLHLREIFSRYFLQDRDFVNILTCCPFLEKLTIGCQSWNPKRNAILSEYQFLTELNIKWFKINGDNINEFLRIFGKKIKKLAFIECQLNLTFVTNFCPHLNILELCQTRVSFLPVDSLYIQPFSNLTYLFLCTSCGTLNQDVKIHEILPYCRSIRKLRMSGGDYKKINLEILIKIPWTHLDSLRFEYIDNFDVSFIEKLIMIANLPLKHLKLEHLKMKKEKIENLKNIIQTTNLDLQLEFYPYEENENINNDYNNDENYSFDQSEECF